MPSPYPGMLLRRAPTRCRSAQKRREFNSQGASPLQQIYATRTIFRPGNGATLVLLRCTSVQLSATQRIHAHQKSGTRVLKLSLRIIKASSAGFGQKTDHSVQTSKVNLTPLPLLLPPAFPLPGVAALAALHLSAGTRFKVRSPGFQVGTPTGGASSELCT
eukprot:1061088-Rhodomonas_salina.1